MTPEQEKAKKAYDERYSALVGSIEQIVKLLPKIQKEVEVTWGDVGDMEFVRNQAVALKHIMRGMVK